MKGSFEQVSKPPLTSLLGTSFNSLLGVLHPCLGHCSSSQSPHHTHTALASVDGGIGACFPFSAESCSPTMGAMDPAPWGERGGHSPRSGQGGAFLRLCGDQACS